MEQIDNIESLMTSLLDLLDIGHPDLSEGYDKIENTKWLIHLGHLYGSQFATSFVTNSLQQIISVRYINNLFLEWKSVTFKFNIWIWYSYHCLLLAIKF